MSEPRYIRIPLPADDDAFEGAKGVIGNLRDAGSQAWVVGGAVRDLVMGLHPDEYDLATSAPPDMVMRLFERTVPVGVQFGVVRVLWGSREYEVATFRADEGYSDGRRPDAIRYTDLGEDVRRRDFTMNGLALDPETGEVADLVGGLADIDSGIIRAIGNPGQRFDEDHLRPLRAVRLAAQTGFNVEPETLAAVRLGAEKTVGVSSERIRDELGKMLRTHRPGTGLILSEQTGLLPVILPEFGSSVPVDSLAGILDELAGFPLETLWAALLEPIGPVSAKAVMKRLHNSRRTSDAVADILTSVEAIAKLPLSDIAAEKRILREPSVPAGLDVLDARLRVTRGDRSCFEHGSRRLLEWTEADLFPHRVVNGVDALSAGVSAGSAVGSALAAVEDEQLRGRIRTRDEALNFLGAYRGEGPGADPGSP